MPSGRSRVPTPRSKSSNRIRTGGVDALAAPTDIADPEAVERVREAFGPVDVLIRSISAKSLEDAWRVGTLGGLLCSKEAIEDMLAADGGTIVFTGATSSIRGREGALGFSSAKFAVRGMAESMARELGLEIPIASMVSSSASAWGSSSGRRLVRTVPT